MLVEILIFSVFNDEKLKKQEICSKISQKKKNLSLHQNAGQLFYSKKICFLQFGNITLNGAPPTPSLHSQYSWQQVNTSSYYIDPQTNISDMVAIRLPLVNAY